MYAEREHLAEVQVVGPLGSKDPEQPRVMTVAEAEALVMENMHPSGLMVEFDLVHDQACRLFAQENLLPHERARFLHYTRTKVRNERGRQDMVRRAWFAHQASLEEDPSEERYWTALADESLARMRQDPVPEVDPRAVIMADEIQVFESETLEIRP